VKSSSKDDKWSREMNFSWWRIGCLTGMLTRRNARTSSLAHSLTPMIHLS